MGGRNGSLCVGPGLSSGSVFSLLWSLGGGLSSLVSVSALQSERLVERPHCPSPSGCVCGAHPQGLPHLWRLLTGTGYSCAQTTAHAAGDWVTSREGGRTCPQLGVTPRGSRARFGATTVTSWPNGKPPTWLRGQVASGGDTEQLSLSLGPRLLCARSQIHFVYF